MSTDAQQTRATQAALDSGLTFDVVRHGRVSSLEEAAEARGVTPADIIKTLVVRRGEDDYLFVLVPGDRGISWPKLRTLLGVKRMTMPSADEALAVTGYERGTITPFGSSRPWPVVADEQIVGRVISLGGGEFGVSMSIDADTVINALGAQVADVTDPL
jgi:Cys-tRNA(Pro)/Cys-tRNA(Cys) deacylase